jgi:MoaA/NifB/PqqE/SkfB family radical SAM enzyme
MQKFSIENMDRPSLEEKYEQFEEIMNDNPLATDKAAHFPWRLLYLRAGRQMPPAQVLLSISDLCNHNCAWCSERDSELPSSEMFPMVKGQVNPDRRMELGKIIDILDNLSFYKVEAVEFTGGGEPTIHPHFADAIHVANKMALAVGLVTNGCRLNALQNAPLDKAVWVRVSIDAGTPETYASLRGVSQDNFEKVFESVAYLASLEGPTVGVSFIVQKENWHSQPAICARLARDAGADYIRFAPLISAAGEAYYGDWGPDAAYCVGLAEKFASPTFQVYNQFSRRKTMYRPVEKKCGYQHFAPYIGADLNVYRCCNTAYTSQGLLGSLRDQSFGQLWYDPKTLEKMLSLDATTCPYCIFTEKNAVINSLTVKPTGHQLFV